MVASPRNQCPLISGEIGRLVDPQEGGEPAMDFDVHRLARRARHDHDFLDQLADERERFRPMLGRRGGKGLLELGDLAPVGLGGRRVERHRCWGDAGQRLLQLSARRLQLRQALGQGDGRDTAHDQVGHALGLALDLAQPALDVATLTGLVLSQLLKVAAILLHVLGDQRRIGEMHRNAVDDTRV